MPEEAGSLRSLASLASPSGSLPCASLGQGMLVRGACFRDDRPLGSASWGAAIASTIVHGFSAPIILGRVLRSLVRWLGPSRPLWP